VNLRSLLLDFPLLLLNITPFTVEFFLFTGEFVGGIVEYQGVTGEFGPTNVESNKDTANHAPYR
jgi:hypothetical protein